MSQRSLLDGVQSKRGWGRDSQHANTLLNNTISICDKRFEEENKNSFVRTSDLVGRFSGQARLLPPRKERRRRPMRLTGHGGGSCEKPQEGCRGARKGGASKRDEQRRQDRGGGARFRASEKAGGRGGCAGVRGRRHQSVGFTPHSSET